MELRDPRNRKMQNLIAFSVSAGIHLTGLLALLSIDACSKDSPDEVVATAGMPLEIPEIKEVNEVQKRNTVLRCLCRIGGRGNNCFRIHREARGYALGNCKASQD